MCVNGEPKTFRSQSNKFFSSTEVSVLDGKRYKSTKFVRLCDGVSGCQRCGDFLCMASDSCDAATSAVSVCGEKVLC